MKIKIAPSILSADFGKLNEEILSVEPYVDMLHVDIMDGHFVPNITFGAPIVRCIKTKLPLDLHLMIENPQFYLEDFVKAAEEVGCKGRNLNITVHQETCKHLHRVLQQIQSFGVKASVALNPATPVQMLDEVLSDVDMVLVMSVNPGFGGQKFIENAVGKIQMLRRLRPDLDIEVDGGIHAETAKECVEAGANILVAGSFIFGTKDRKVAIESLYKEAFPRK